MAALYCKTLGTDPHTPPPCCALPASRFYAINGLLLPGGGATLKPGHRFYDTAHQLVDLAIKANDKGDFFPVRFVPIGQGNGT
jgi:hypothetical protein